MMKVRFLFITAMLLPLAVCAQRDDRGYVRKGNKLYSDSLFIKAEENYLKALDKNSGSVEASFNLGNTYLEQQKAKEAAEQYQKAATVMELERDKLISSSASEKELKNIKERTAQAYHNLGVVMQSSQNYGPAIAAYQEALKNNPADNETRFNLAQAMRQLKEQQNQQQDQQQDQQQQDQQQDQQQQNQQQQQQNQQQQDQQQQDQQQQDQQQQDQQQQQDNKDDMSKENAEQLLQAAMQDEKDVQERVQQMMQVQSKGKLEKDW